MEKENRKTALYLTQSAVTAALYVALTLIFQPISFGAVQVRVSEMLTVLPRFTSAAVPGLFIGCLLANILGGAVVIDVVFGSLATLAGAVIAYLLRKNRWLVPLPSVVANAITVPLVLKYAYAVDLPLPAIILYVAIGEVISCYILGEIFISAVQKRKDIFPKK